jgi:hypothetical protein
MARPLKNSLAYFSFDTDFFNCRKIRRLLNGIGGKGGFGGKGALVFICLLCEAYRENGYFIGWDAEYSQYIADLLGAGFSAGLVNEVKTVCLDTGLFDKDLYDRHTILTSASMQARFITAKTVTSKRKYKPEDIIKPEYLASELANYTENYEELPGKTENYEVKRSYPAKSKVKKNKDNNHNPQNSENHEPLKKGVFDASAFIPPQSQIEDPAPTVISGKITATVAQLEEFRSAIGAMMLSETEKMHVSYAIEQGCTVEHLKKLLAETPKINSFKADWVIRALMQVKRTSETSKKGEDALISELEGQYGSLT